MYDKRSLKKAQVGGGEESGMSFSVVDPEIKTRKRVIASHARPLDQAGAPISTKAVAVASAATPGYSWGHSTPIWRIWQTRYHIMWRKEGHGVSSSAVRLTGSTNVQPDRLALSSHHKLAETHRICGPKIVGYGITSFNPNDCHPHYIG